MVAQADMRLGKKPARHDPRTLRLSRYLDHAALPPIPAQYAWGTPILDWGMMENDSIGDCTIAAAAHMIQAWSVAAAGTAVTIPDEEIVKAYSAITGYVPGDPSTDGGAVLLDVLNYWRKTGIAGHKILAYAAVNVGNVAEVNAAIYLFGGVYAGIELPISAQDQIPWYVPECGLQGDGRPNSWGGHCVAINEYAPYGDVCITWGFRHGMQREFADAYNDEAFAIIAPEWFCDGKAPNGFDLATLQADLELVTA